MKKIILSALFLVFTLPSVNAAEQYSTECVRDFQDMVYTQLSEDNKINPYHQIWYWVPGKVLQGETGFSCTDWATNNGIEVDGSENIEELNKACIDLKEYSEKLANEFDCRKRTI